jgi:squalene-hopene/tetraprenyl-beta-curcumene cyclase
MRVRPAFARFLAAWLPIVSLFAAAPAGAADREQAIARAHAFLRDQAQADDGSFSAQAGPAVTALVVTALARTGMSPDSETVKKGLDYLMRFRAEDGGIHPEDSPVANYETCIAMMALSACNEGGRYDDEIAKAEAFVKGLQWDDGEGHGSSDPSYGGAGYGRKKRPDLSNTSFLIDALKSVGRGPDDPAIKRALVFVSRTQNLEGPDNPLPFAAKNPDGGFYYTPAAGGESQAGTTPEGGLRSYASMTYAGLKSMIFAGLTKDDPRVKAAIAWLSKHYTFEENPGMGDAGLYYYYQTAAKALDALGQETFTDRSGNSHRWRDELADEIMSRQQPDGSWINANARWMEGDPNLVTAYALLALSYCRK